MQTYLHRLAERLQLTNFDEPEEYTLTPDEEQSAIQHAISREKEHFVFRMADKGFSEMEVLARISQVDWENEIDRQQVLKISNSNKNQQLWQKAQRDLEKKQKEEIHAALKKEWTATALFKYLRYVSRNEYGKELIVNDNNLRLIKILCFFISEDPRFETEFGYDLKKGLLLRGSCGLGKTFIPKCLKDNQLRPILIINMNEISSEVKTSGEYEVPFFSHILYLDDVGTEETPIKFYGTSINWFKNFFENFYFKNIPFNKLIISTNNSAQEIEEKYGFRIRSRIKETFNIIDITGNDMRQ